MKASFHIEFLLIVAALIVIPYVICAASTSSASEITQIGHPTKCESTSGAKHAFVVKVKDELSAIVNKVRSKITDNGGKFEGDTEHGTFDGK